ncbi:MAG: ATP-binding protein [Aestuariibacter sp.]
MARVQINEVTMFLLGSFVACMINYYPVPFFTGSELIFGNAIAIAITILFGWRCGLICSVLASAVCYFTWGHVLAMLPHALEVLIIAYAVQRGKSFILYGIAYWLLLGWVIVALEYMIFTDYQVTTKIAIVIKYVVNGGLNILAGYILARILRPYSVSAWHEAQQLRHYVSTTFFIIITFGALAITFFWLRVTQNDSLNQIRNELSTDAQVIGNALQEHLLEHLSALELTSQLYSDDASRQNMQLYLDKLARQYPSVLTLLATDAQGLITHSSPNTLLAALRGDNDDVISVADRPYFYEVKDLQQSFVSDVFQGRGFGNDPIVALSTPYYEDGRFAGVIEASLDLIKLKDLDTKRFHSDEMVLIFDKNNRVIYASEGLGYTFLQPLSDLPVLHHRDEPYSYFFINHQREYLIASYESIESLNWQVATFIPRLVYETQIAKYVITSLSLVIFLLLVTGIYTVNLAGKLAAPFVYLTKQLKLLNSQSQFGHFELDMRPSNIEEVNQLAKMIELFSEKLNQTLSSLSDANLQTNEANAKLANMNQNLSFLVAEQTKKIREALYDANNANRAKSEFLATMSHEIRTPMNGVLGMLELLRHTDLQPDQENKVSIAESSARSLLSLINDVLDFSKIEADKIALEVIEFSLIALISDIIQSFGVKAQERQLKLILDTEKVQVDRINADPTRLRQVITNLVSNALKFTKEGTVTVICETSLRQGRADITIDVVDTGIGIPEDMVPHLFDPFTQADSSTTRNFGGTGLGLAISQRLCGVMGGSLQLESAAGEGSRFTVTLNADVADVLFVPDSLEQSYHAIYYLKSGNDQHIRNLIKRSHKKPLFINDAADFSKAYTRSGQCDSELPCLCVFYAEQLTHLSNELKNTIKTRGDVVAVIRSIDQQVDVDEFEKTAIINEPVTPVQFHHALTGKPKLAIQQFSNLPETPLSKLKVLLVEDNPINQQIAQNMLETFNCKVDTADNGLRAMAKLKSAKRPYDVVLMDCQMPEMDGYETTQRIRAGEAGAALRDMVIIALTANAMKGDKEKCLDIGMTDYLSKPISLEILRQTIEKYSPAA